MEQQTISISKAGIHASLNARTSILAAANPVYGRYDKSKPLRQNLNISAPIMSRFDLFYIVTDESDVIIDTKIAKHIIDLHRSCNEGYTDIITNRIIVPSDFTQKQLRDYIYFAKTIQPIITPEAKEHLVKVNKTVIVKVYKILRRNDAVGASQQSYR